MRNWVWQYRLDWTKPSEYKQLRWWAFHIWNEYDDWLFNGVHGIRVLGLDIGQIPQWLERVCWKLLPVIRFFNRRPERILGVKEE